MSGRTRLRLALFALVACVALPVETALVSAMRAPSDTMSAESWVSSLTTPALQDAAMRVEEYPYHYRRAIMTALEPAERAMAWRRFLARFVSSHPELDPAARGVIARMSAAMTADLFDDDPPSDRLISVAALFDAATGLLGRRTAIDLFITLGPDDGSTEALPVAQRWTEAVRGWVTAHASRLDCDCSTAFSGTCDTHSASSCTDAMACELDANWPACGVAWSFPCNGTCTIFSPRRQ